MARGRHLAPKRHYLDLEGTPFETRVPIFKMGQIQEHSNDIFGESTLASEGGGDTYQGGSAVPGGVGCVHGRQLPLTP